MTSSLLANDFVPGDDASARSIIIGILRERCPTGFSPIEKSDKIARLTPSRRKSIASWAASFPGALNIPDMDGRTPLAWLARYEEPALLRQFLALGANPRGAASSSPHGIHPVAQACELRHGASLEVIAMAAGVEDILFGIGPGSSAEYPCSGARALFMAAMNTNIRGMETLLAIGADANALTAHGDTPMHALAIFQKKALRAMPCAELLAGKFPDMIFAENNAGFTPAALATLHESPMAAPLLAMEEARRLLLAQLTSTADRQASPRL